MLFVISDLFNPNSQCSKKHGYEIRRTSIIIMSNEYDEEVYIFARSVEAKHPSFGYTRGRITSPSITSKVNHKTDEVKITFTLSQFNF